jgi:hypothetical protein
MSDDAVMLAGTAIVQEPVAKVLTLPRRWQNY